MPVRTGGDLPDPINTETEYAGIVPMPNTVGDLGPNERLLSPSEKLRLGYLTGQDEDPTALREPGFMGGVDSRHPDHPELQEYIGPNFFDEGYEELAFAKLVQGLTDTLNSLMDVVEEVVDENTPIDWGEV